MGLIGHSGGPMINKMYVDKVNEQNSDIFILSQLSLQTDSIAYAINREMNIRCQIFDQELNIFPDSILSQVNSEKKEIKSSLVLIDREIHRFKYLMQDITENKNWESLKIALFNINEKTTVEKSFMTKQIRGIFYKDDHLDTFLKGIRAIIGNEIWISRETLLQYIFDEGQTRREHFERNNNLTKREIEILTLVSMGATNDEIAEKVFISTNTVKTHLYNIFKKIDVQNRIQAALWAAKKL